MFANIDVPAEGYEFYIRLVWLFSVLFFVLVFCICYLYLSMRRSQEREQLSFEFSNLVIEGLETERRRVSRELHDNILPQVHDLNVSEQIRSICRELMPPDFLRLSLKDSLAELCVQFSRRTDVECACSMDEDLDFSPLSAENRLHLYRMVQEAFTNIEKHSKTTRASFVARRNMAGASESILICVSDEGRGLPAAAAEGLGFRSMRQRAVLLGAKLDFKSESGNGLMVRIEIPRGKRG